MEPKPAGQDACRYQRIVWFVAAVATLVKLVFAFRTRGTVDVASFWDFGGRIGEYGMAHLWKSDPLFNHMPLVGWFASVLRAEFPQDPQSFSFWWRVPAIAADLVALRAVLMVANVADAPVRRAVLLFAASPVSLMISGFHGNVDSIMTAFLALAAAFSSRGRLWPSALALAFAFNVKAAGLIVAPLFLAYWVSRGAGMRFFAAASAVTLAGWIYPICSDAAVFARNVLSYGGYWGTWGITYWLRETGWEPWKSVRFGDYTTAQTAVIFPLKAAIVGMSFRLAWERRKTGALWEGLAVLWLVVMTLAPSGAAQYLIWCSPFFAVALARVYPWVTAASAVHLFIFYTVLCGGVPWQFGIAREPTNWIWQLSSNIPWFTFAVCLYRNLRTPSATRVSALGQASAT